MSFIHDLSSSRISRVVDPRRLLPYLAIDRSQISKSKSKSQKKRSKAKEKQETRVRRYDRQQSTVLNIRFGSSQGQALSKERQELPKINTHRVRKIEQPQQQEKQKSFQKMHPHIRYRKSLSPQSHLKSLGYNPDVRLASEAYADKVQQRKDRYLNRMETMRRSIEQNEYLKSNKSLRNKIQVKILGEEIRRRREQRILKKQEKEGRKMLKSLLLREGQTSNIN